MERYKKFFKEAELKPNDIVTYGDQIKFKKQLERELRINQDLPFYFDGSLLFYFDNSGNEENTNFELKSNTTYKQLKDFILSYIKKNGIKLK